MAIDDQAFRGLVGSACSENLQERVGAVINACKQFERLLPGEGPQLSRLRNAGYRRVGEIKRAYVIRNIAAHDDEGALSILDAVYAVCAFITSARWLEKRSLPAPNEDPHDENAHEWGTVQECQRCGKHAVCTVEEARGEPFTQCGTELLSYDEIDTELVCGACSELHGRAREDLVYRGGLGWPGDKPAPRVPTDFSQYAHRTDSPMPGDSNRRW